MFNIKNNISESYCFPELLIISDHVECIDNLLVIAFSSHPSLGDLSNSNPVMFTNYNSISHLSRSPHDTYLLSLGLDHLIIQHPNQ